MSQSSNPIEHLWDVVERELRALDVHPSNLHQLQYNASILNFQVHECIVLYGTMF